MDRWKLSLKAACLCFREGSRFEVKYSSYMSFKYKMYQIKHEQKTLFVTHERKRHSKVFTHYQAETTVTHKCKKLQFLQWCLYFRTDIPFGSADVRV